MGFLVEDGEAQRGRKGQHSVAEMTECHLVRVTEDHYLPWSLCSVVASLVPRLRAPFVYPTRVY